jgi:DNA-directed RNA polymerase subunit E'/Rpb7
VEIKKDCGVRLRIIGITVEAELKAVGSMKDDYLGLVSAAVPTI